MERDEILAVLTGREGVQLPGRGVDADDALFGRYRKLDPQQRTDFWRDFAAALKELWDAKDADGFDAAVVFVVRLSGDDRPTAEQSQQNGEFLLDEVVKRQGDAIAGGPVRRLVAAALRLLVDTGLGNENWWLKQFHPWRDVAADFAKGQDDPLVWQALLHASLGLMAGGKAPSIDAWFHVARRAREFPTVEVFTVLAEQARGDLGKDELIDGVVGDFQALQLVCGGKVCPPGVEALRSVIEAWLVERMGLKLAEARKRLKPEKVRKEPPWDILNRPLDGSVAVRP